MVAMVSDVVLEARPAKFFVLGLEGPGLGLGLEGPVLGLGLECPGLGLGLGLECPGLENHSQ